MTWRDGDLRKHKNRLFCLPSFILSKGNKSRVNSVLTPQFAIKSKTFAYSGDYDEVSNFITNFGIIGLQKYKYLIENWKKSNYGPLCSTNLSNREVCIEFPVIFLIIYL